MARKWNGRTSGAKVGGKAVRLWVCAVRSCSVWYELGAGKPSQCKYCGGTEFIYMPSKAEALRYVELVLLIERGQVSDLELQPRFPLLVVTAAGDVIKIGEYRADFRYIQDGKTVVEDVKGGADTEMSHWKRRHVDAQYGIKIEIVKR